MVAIKNWVYQWLYDLGPEFAMDSVTNQISCEYEVEQVNLVLGLWLECTHCSTFAKVNQIWVWTVPRWETCWEPFVYHLELHHAEEVSYKFSKQSIMHTVQHSGNQH